MQVKKFEAPTIQEALDHVKRELGPEAIILQTKKSKRGFGIMSKATVEVTAAVSERSLGKKQAVEVRIPEASKQIINKYSAEKQAQVFDKFADRHIEQAVHTRDQVTVADKSKRITATRYIDIDENKGAQTRSPVAKPQSRESEAKSPERANSEKAKPPLEDEVRQLKRMIQDLKSAQDEIGRAHAEGQNSGSADNSRIFINQISLDNPLLQDAFEQLVVNGMDRRYALSLVKKVGFELGGRESDTQDKVSDLLANEIMDSLEILSPLSDIKKETGSGIAPSPKLIALIGPTGVGKTTTIAKLASDAIKRGFKVGLITLDSQKIGAFEQLGMYSKILGVPFRTAGSIDDLKAALSDYRSLDLVLLDTSGCSQKDPESLKKMQDLFNIMDGLRSFLVLSATTRDVELYEIVNRFAAFRPEGLVISKLDEASVYGSIYNVFQKSKLPLLYFTTGQKVPDDIEEATRERVASLVMEI
jgi:flagellar biosynthesis protein FlhF